MSYLHTQFQEFKKSYPSDIIRQYKDGTGPYCYLCSRIGKKWNYLFVAKNSYLPDAKGILVSIEKNLLYEAVESGIRIVMCLKGTFYRFHGSQVLNAKEFENVHSDQKMVNFYLANVKPETLPLKNSPNVISNFIPTTAEQLKLQFDRTKQ